MSKTCSIIEANILNIARQDYEPQGASVTVLISEEPIDPKTVDTTEHTGPLPDSVVAHLDKSHICVHTCPESHPEGGLCTFRADIVTVDYRVRGFTRDTQGVKHFIDHDITSIQNFMPDSMKQSYDMVDVNVYQENIFHTKMMLKDFDLDHYIFKARPEAMSDVERRRISDLLWKEMHEIYFGRNMP